MVDLKLLKTFVAVANHSSFTGAAKERYIAQSAVSKHINLLEQELGVQLFLRDTRMVRLTQEGERFYHSCVQILEELDEAVTTLRLPRQAQVGRLRAGAFSVLADEAVSVLRAFRQVHPQVRTQLDWFEFGQLIHQVDSGGVDVAFTMGFARTGRPHLRRRTLERGRLQVLLSPYSPLAHRPVLRLADLAGLPYYSMQPNVTPDGYLSIMRFFAQHQFQPQLTLPHSSHESMLLQLQLHDDGFGLMSEFQYRRHPGLVMIPLADEEQPQDDSFDLVALWRENNENPCIPRLLSVLDTIYPLTE